MRDLLEYTIAKAIKKKFFGEDSESALLPSHVHGGGSSAIQSSSNKITGPVAPVPRSACLEERRRQQTIQHDVGNPSCTYQRAFASVTF